MKFVCQSSNLLHEIELANNFSSSKNSLSIASNVLLETANDKLTIKATDQRLGFTTSINAMTVISGSTTVFCEKLTQLLKNIPDTEIEIDEMTQDTSLQVYIWKRKEMILFLSLQMEREWLMYAGILNRKSLIFLLQSYL